MPTELFRQLSDRELLEVTARAAADERRSTVELVQLLSEVDARRLYLGQGCSSLFTYCTNVLRLSESAAYRRIEAARAIRVFPLVAERLRDGSMTLTTVALLRSHLTIKNHVELLTEARNKSKREVEQLIARRAPKPEVAALVRRLPDTAVAASAAGVTSELAATPHDNGSGLNAEEPVRARELRSIAGVADLPTSRSPQAKVEPLASDRYLLRVSLSAAGYENLRRAQGLMRHSLPSGDLAGVVERALNLLVERLEQRKFARGARPHPMPSQLQPITPSTSPPRSTLAPPSKSPSTSSPPSGGKTSASRYLPASVRRSVWKRDQGRCAFIGPHGRCNETGRLEFHHIVPFARGGSASASNVALRCRAHNAYEGEICFGRRL